MLARKLETLEYSQQYIPISVDRKNPSNPRNDDSQSNYSFDDSQSYNQPDEVESYITKLFSNSSIQESNYPLEEDQNSSQVTPSPITISLQLQEIINRFNQQRPELFRDFPSQPLTLTQDNIHGKLGSSGRRILQLEVPADPSQGVYLKFEMDNESWLIPNITSPYIGRIMSNLSGNYDIFTIIGGSGSSLNLVMPAKLKVSTDNPGIWEIQEPGIFQANEQNTEPSQQKIKKG